MGPGLREERRLRTSKLGKGWELGVWDFHTSKNTLKIDKIFQYFVFYCSSIKDPSVS